MQSLHLRLLTLDEISTFERGYQFGQGVGTLLAVLGLVGLLIYFIRKNRRNKNQQKP